MTDYARAIMADKASAKALVERAIKRGLLSKPVPVEMIRKDTRECMARKRSGFKTAKEIVSERGVDWREVMEKRI